MKKDEAKPSAIPSLSKPRGRVLEHMRKLVRASAFAMGSFGLAASESCSPLVCDPLPPPMTCNAPTAEQVRQNVSWIATWVAADGGAPAIEVTLHVEAKNLGITGAPTLTGATLVRSDAAGAAPFHFTVQPDTGAKSVDARLPMTCDGAPLPVILRLATSGTTTPGSSVPGTLLLP